MANVLIRVSALAATALALALVYVQLPVSDARYERPICEGCNVVLISFDTVRADHLGAYGYERPTSPNVDALARKSIVFERAISQAPWTLPAHGSMLSGLYPGRLGVTRYPASRLLPDQNPVLPEVFRAAGYATAGFTGGGFVSDHYGFQRGFDVYETYGRRFEHNIDATIEWVNEHKDKPFFLFVHGYDAHRPYYSKTADKEALGIPPDGPVDQNRFCLRDDRARPDDKRLEEIVRYYDASIHHGDRAIGVFLKMLEEMQLMEKTVILLTSDHGEEFFEHGNCDHVRFLYDESLHVPFMILAPGLAPEGNRIPDLVPASISVARTVLDIVGIDHAMPGVTLLPMLRGNQRGFPVVYSEADSTPGSLGSRGRSTAMTKSDMKLISYLDEGADEAYDMKADPDELQPLPERHVAYLMRQSLRAWSEALRPLPRPPGPAGKAPAPSKDGTEEEYEPASEGEGEGEESPLAAPGAGSSDAAPAGSGAAGVAGNPASSARAVDKTRTTLKPREKGPGGARAAKGGTAPGPAPEPAPDAEEEEMEIPKELEESLKSLGYLE